MSEQMARDMIRTDKPGWKKRWVIRTKRGYIQRVTCWGALGIFFLTPKIGEALIYENREEVIQQAEKCRDMRAVIKEVEIHEETMKPYRTTGTLVF
jgi:hypothetical protein